MTEQCAVTARQAPEMSWLRPAPELSLKLVRRTGISCTAPLIDVGGGASSLVDCLLTHGFTDVSVVDVASPGLEEANTRLGERAAMVDWIVADVTAWRPCRTFQLWHDHAVLHFLVEPSAQSAYADALRAAVAPEGWAIIGGIAPGGPAKCSGLNIVQHDAISLCRLLGDDFQLMEAHGEVHATPWGDQAFRCHVLRRKGAKLAQARRLACQP